MRPQNIVRTVVAMGMALGMLTVAGCHHPPPAAAQPAAAPPAAPPPRPTVTLQAAPTFIEQGQTSQLSWSSTNATKVVLGGESVAPEGTKGVAPEQSTTYSITASGPGGDAATSVRVTVSPAPKTVEVSAPPLPFDELFRQNVRDAFFDYDKYDIRADARDSLARTAEFLRRYPETKVAIEGHCDERGSLEYNLALGAERAEATKKFLNSLGIEAGRMNTISYGKERPFCNDHEESCWQQNRRGHFVAAK
ncbi:MAG TPA: peptidoglycan-associated lipoprotein Pal [Candidatus Acidoferrales bacterium]|nr:peptidoglycan-associated lipoprotein Pal [Candidatus Acidoferrales bacterium]